MLRFITVFPEAENVHLTKDVGLIPYVLQKHYQYQSTLASYKNGEYPAISSEIEGLKQIFIRRIFCVQLLDVLWFLLLNSHKYDILNIYHLKHSSWIFGLFFKMVTFNRGRVYLKLDADHQILKYFPKGIKRLLFKFIFAKIDFISVESSQYQRYLNGTGLFSTDVHLIPNGFYDFFSEGKICFSEKENIIITVGRIGTQQKATEVLCDAFKHIEDAIPDWTLLLIGPIEADFKPFIERLYISHPDLKNRIRFLGPVTDRRQLNSYYSAAKVFVLTSRWEGFPIVFAEAMHGGCFVVSSDLSAARDISGEGKYGRLFPVDDAGSLSRILKEVCGNQEMLAENCDVIQELALKRFSWIPICGDLDLLLN